MLSKRAFLAPPKSAGAAAGLVVVGAFCIQWAAALAVPAFSSIGALATAGWRFLFGAVVLTLVVRPRIRSWTKRQWAGAALFGVVTALMNLSFYQALGRIHLGSAVAIEYLGPFLLAAFGKRSWRHLIFVLLAALGVVALARPGSGLNWQGALFAAGAGLGWALYIYFSHRVGSLTDGFEGLAVAMMVSSLCTVAFIFPSVGQVAASPSLAGRLLAMSVLATVIGFGVELVALRRLAPPVVGVLLALNPAVAFLVGLVILAQSVKLLDVVGMVLVVTAGIAVTRGAEEKMVVSTL